MAATALLTLLAAAPLPGTAPPAGAVSPYFDASGREGSLYRLYRAYFLREPDAAGFTYWYFTSLGHGSMAPISDHFARTPEFATRYGSLDQGGFVDLVYRNVLSREPDPGGREYWLRRLRDGLTQGSLMLLFSDSAEFRSRTAAALPPGYRAGSNAGQVLAALTVQPEGTRSGFGPASFGGWLDSDGDGCDTACERFAVERRSDGTWFSLWDGELTTERSALRVDHVVSLAEAWESGASAWSSEQRSQFANWGVNLAITSASTDGAKGDGDPADWYPPRAASNCALAETVLATKLRWGLTVDPPEVVALGKMLNGCRPGTSDPPPVPRPAPDRVFTYSVEQRGTVSTDLEQFAAHAARTMADPRGWSLGGSVEYRRVPSGGHFTLVLSEASRVPSFGPPCDSTWSCRSGRYVIVNETRWRLASASWTLGLDDYRHYVVNHELGHWLGQRHTTCPGTGRPAPVMMQQSIDRGACTNNVWPLAGERRAVADRHGVGIRG